MRRFATVLFATCLLSGVAQAQTLRIGLTDDPDTLDPTVSRTFVGTIVFTAMCDKLFDMDEHLAIVPRLATGYQWADPKTLILHLRDGVQFQDGEPFDADAVKYTLERYLTYPGSFRRAEIGAIDHIDVVDPHTVRIVLKQPNAAFIAQFTDRAGMMLAPKAAQAAGKDFGLHPVCAGPFSFAERISQDHITLDRFKNYWDAGAIHFDHVVYRPMSDSTVRLTNLQSGSLDLTLIVPTDVDAVKNDPHLRLVVSPGLGYGGITLNLGAGPRADSPLGRDPRVRHAFELAIDRTALIQVVYNGMYTPNAQATAAAHPLYDKALPIPPRDIPQAKALLQAGGVATPFPVELLIANNPQSRQVGEVLQSMVKDAGFDLHVVTQEFGAALAAEQGGNYQAYLGGWSGLLDPDSNIWGFLHSGAAQNWSRYSNPTVDSLLDAARATDDADQRRTLYARMWQQEAQDLPIIYLWTPSNIVGTSAKLQGFRPMPDGLIRLQGVSLVH
jgi:peptide/nickel transport system substrate-binding protein